MEKYKISTISDKKQIEKNWLIIQIIGCYNLKYIIERVPIKEEADLQGKTPEGLDTQRRLMPKKGQGE